VEKEQEEEGMVGQHCTKKIGNCLAGRRGGDVGNFDFSGGKWRVYKRLGLMWGDGRKKEGQAGGRREDQMAKNLCSKGESRETAA